MSSHVKKLAALALLSILAGCSVQALDPGIYECKGLAPGAPVIRFSTADNLRYVPGPRPSLIVSDLNSGVRVEMIDGAHPFYHCSMEARKARA